MAAPIPVDDDSYERILIELIDFLEAQPEVAIFSSLLLSVSGVVFLGAIVWSIGRAGRFQPPVVVLSVITGLVALISLLAVIIRPEVEALGVAAGAAIGSLGGALGTAYSIRSKEHQRQDHIAETTVVCPHCGYNVHEVEPTEGLG